MSTICVPEGANQNYYWYP